MLRNIFMNKWILGSFALLLIIASAYYFWDHHTTVQYERETVPDTSITEDQQRELDLIIDDYKSKISTMSHRRERYDLWSSMRSNAYQEMQEAQRLLHEKDFIGTSVDQFFKYMNSLTEQEKDEFYQEYAKHLNAYKYAYAKFEMLSSLNPLAKENSNEK